jgi:hypothetical protein
MAGQALLRELQGQEQRCIVSLSRTASLWSDGLAWLLTRHDVTVPLRGYLGDCLSCT